MECALSSFVVMCVLPRDLCGVCFRVRLWFMCGCVRVVLCVWFLRLRCERSSVCGCVGVVFLTECGACTLASGICVFYETCALLCLVCAL